MEFLFGLVCGLLMAAWLNSSIKDDLAEKHCKAIESRHEFEKCKVDFLDLDNERK